MTLLALSAADLERLRLVHRPTDRAGYRVAARQMLDGGLEPATVARVLGLTVGGVRELLSREAQSREGEVRI